MNHIKKIVCLCLLMLTLSIRSSLPLVEVNEEQFSIKALVPQNTQPAEMSNKIIRTTAIQNPTKLQEKCKDIYESLPALTKKLNFDNVNPFLNELSSDKQIELAKKLLRSLNISTEQVLYLTNLSYRPQSLSHLVNAKSDFDYLKLTSLCTILLEIIKTTYITLEASQKNHEEEVRAILTFVKDNLFKIISVKSSSSDDPVAYGQSRIVHSAFDTSADYTLTNQTSIKFYEEEFTIPIVPYDAIILLGKILNDVTRKAVIDLKKNDTITLDEFNNVYFKIEFLKNYGFFSPPNDLLYNLIYQNYDSKNVSLQEKSSSTALALTGKSKSKEITKFSITTITKEELSSIYNSILNNVSFSKNNTKNQYTLKNDMSIIEICSMFVKLNDALKKGLITLIKDNAQAIINKTTKPASNISNLPAVKLISSTIPNQQKLITHGQQNPSIPENIVSLLEKPQSQSYEVKPPLSAAKQEPAQQLQLQEPSVSIIPEPGKPQSQSYEVKPPLSAVKQEPAQQPQVEEPSVNVIPEGKKVVEASPAQQDKEIEKQSWQSWSLYALSWVNPWSWYIWYYDIKVK